MTRIDEMKFENEQQKISSLKFEDNRFSFCLERQCKAYAIRTTQKPAKKEVKRKDRGETYCSGRCCIDQTDERGPKSDENLINDSTVAKHSEFSPGMLENKVAKPENITFSNVTIAHSPRSSCVSFFPFVSHRLKIFLYRRFYHSDPLQIYHQIRNRFYKLQN